MRRLISRGLLFSTSCPNLLHFHLKQFKRCSVAGICSSIRDRLPNTAPGIFPVRCISHSTGNLLRAWHGAGIPLVTMEQISVEELRHRIDENSVDVIVDVRRPPEWDAGHIAQATSMPLNHLMESASTLNLNARISTICAGGYRSSIATSLLEQLGFRSISNVVGGMTAWNNAKLALAS